MRAFELNRIEKLYFSTNDIAKALSITPESAKVTTFRYAKAKIITKIKKDIYILSHKIPFLTEEELFKLANIIQTPSYISLTTALSYYNISTQQQRDFIESIALKKTKSLYVGNVNFSFVLIKPNLYREFILQNGFFIATQEKALADAVYLSSLNRYSCDFDAIHFKKLDLQKIEDFLKDTNKMTINFWIRLCKTYKI